MIVYPHINWCREIASASIKIFKEGYVVLENKSEDLHTLSSEESEFLGQLLAKERSTVLYVIKNVLGNLYTELRDECLSEVYWLAMRKVDDMMHFQNPDKWIVVSAKYVALHVKYTRCKYLDHISTEDIEDIEFSEDVFETALYNIWLEQDVYNLLKKELTKRERQVFELIFEQNKSCKEVAAQLGISESTVWNIRKSIKDKYRYAIKNKLF